MHSCAPTEGEKRRAKWLFGNPPEIYRDLARHQPPAYHMSTTDLTDLTGSHRISPVSQISQDFTDLTDLTGSHRSKRSHRSHEPRQIPLSNLRRTRVVLLWAYRRPPSPHLVKNSASRRVTVGVPRSCSDSPESTSDYFLSSHLSAE